MIPFKKMRLALVFTGFLAGFGAQATEVVVIVNAQSPLTLMTVEQVRDIYLGKNSNLPTGATAVMADLPEDNPACEAFYGQAIGKNLSQIRAIWSRLTFSGKGIPPKRLGSSDEVKKYVSGNSDGIGYIDKAAVDASVKVVLTLN